MRLDVWFMMYDWKGFSVFGSLLSALMKDDWKRFKQKGKKAVGSMQGGRNT